MTTRGLSGRDALSRWHLPAAMLVALALQVIIAVRSPVVSPDGITFVRIAQELQADPITAIRTNAQHPGYPAMILAVQTVASRLVEGNQSWLISGRIVSGYFGIVCLLLIWLISNQAFSRRVADVAVWLGCALPVFRQNAADALSDSPHLALYLAAAWSAGRALNSKAAHWFLVCGVSSGLAYWVRPEGLSVAPLAAVCLVACRHRLQLSWWQVLRGSCLILLGTFLVVAPYVLLVGKLTDKMSAKSGWQAVRAGVAQKIEPPVAAIAEPPVVIPGRQSPLEQLPGHRVVSSALGRLGERLAECLRYVLLIMLLLGTPAALRRFSRPSGRLLFLLAATHICLLIVLYAVSGYMGRRHLMPLVAMLIPTLAAGTLALRQLLRRRTGRAAAPLQLVMVALVLLALLPRCLRPLNGNRLHTIQAGQQILAAAQSHGLVASNSIHVLFYATASGQPLRGQYLDAALSLPVPDSARPTVLALESVPDNYGPHWQRQLRSHYDAWQTISGDPAVGQRDIILYRARR